MTTTRLTQAKAYRNTDQMATYELHYIRGGDEASVRVTDTGDEVAATCRELPADSHMDEIVLEEHAEQWAREHGRAMGNIEEAI